MTSSEDIRNLAIVAHVDHGKTSLVDSLLWQAALLDRGLSPEAAGHDLDRLKTISLMPKVASTVYKTTRINLVDAPEHAHDGGEVARSMGLVDGVMLIVDACEGPVPPTRFPLRSAVELGLPLLLVINKIDQPDARPAQALTEVKSLLADLGAREQQRNPPVVYTNARRGVARRHVDGPDGSLEPLLISILEHVPAPGGMSGQPARMLVSHLDHDPFYGRVAIGRIQDGEIRAGDPLLHWNLDGSRTEARVGSLFRYQGTDRREVESASAGEIVAIGGVEAVRHGETLSAAAATEPLPATVIEEPSICVTLAPNDSPLAGKEGSKNSIEELRERLWGELLTHASLQIEESSNGDGFRLASRGDLQLAILLEMLRRDGFEMSVSRPAPLCREHQGRREEAVERVIVDCPAVYASVVQSKVESRSGEAVDRVDHPSGWVHLEFLVPARGMTGLRSEFLADTRGRGILNHHFERYATLDGEPPQRGTGALVSDRAGRCTEWAIDHLQPRGTMFVNPGDPVYEGMIVGESSFPEDKRVNVVREAPPSDPESPRLPRRSAMVIPPRTLGLSEALEFIREDELVEVTPRAVRMRKRQP